MVISPAHIKEMQTFHVIISKGANFAPDHIKDAQTIHVITSIDANISPAHFKGHKYFTLKGGALLDWINMWSTTMKN